MFQKGGRWRKFNKKFRRLSIPLTDRIPEIAHPHVLPKQNVTNSKVIDSIYSRRAEKLGSSSMVSRANFILISEQILVIDM